MNMNMNLNLNAKVKALRELRGFTQKSVAKAAGITQPYLVAIEKGRVNPQDRVFVNLFEAMGIELVISKQLVWGREAQGELAGMDLKYALQKQADYVAKKYTNSPVVNLPKGLAIEARKHWEEEHARICYTALLTDEPIHPDNSKLYKLIK